MHALYADAPQRIYTRAILNELLGKPIDILTPTLLLEVSSGCPCPQALTVYESLRSAFESLYHQLTTTQGPIKLSFDQCSALRRVKDVVRWDFIWPDDEELELHYREVPRDHSVYWSDLEYYELVFTGEPLENSLVSKLAETMLSEYEAKKYARRYWRPREYVARIHKRDRGT